ncbi:MAG TPA: bifunctional adenosylcobinamide kinase/adenosylcobinamide-phosphate guanylyltransferase [Thermodesulfobacteriaceae bacterium]|nr:bifunctional adenosylcobinamide kinase/adenosylcobinamide-phosphate guanylyltransferase [Thermodesulfobacteriaceae bacterium]
MENTFLITGGARSGKTRFALDLAGKFPGQKVYLATSPVTDPEMEGRIERHRMEREGRGWKTVEETISIASVLGGLAGGDVVVVDCLTLWMNNLILGFRGDVNETVVEDKCRALLDVCRRRRGKVVFVTNEVGSGIVPENALARRYRDLMGRCNQVVAQGVDAVFVVVSGIPFKIKCNRSDGSAPILMPGA